MRLKRLEVFGFKSFFDKTVVTFRSGINGIVGPNGCGKSNLSDAILWVLGEQSPKNLRGERMEDVIFNGTEQRKPLGAAEVSLTVGEITKPLPSPYTPYGEITFSRRLYRSGESEYLINKTPCRLKDIRDLLIDMGAGYKAHTIIEQGRVDELVTASPQQRREIVEEAAGIAKYRVRKAEAIRKLDATEQNLIRVRDIIDEITRQRNALDRQAKKAEKYQSLQSSLKSLEIQIARREWTAWNQRLASLRGEEERLQEKSAELAGRKAAIDLRLTENKAVLAQKGEALERSNRENSDLEGGVQRLEGKQETIHAQRKEWLEALSQSDEEIEHIEQELLSHIQERDLLETQATEIARTLPEKERHLLEHDREAAVLEEGIGSISADIERQKAALFHLAAQLTTSKNNLIHFHDRKETLCKQIERRVTEEDTVSENLEATEASLKRVSSEWNDTEKQLAKRRMDLAETDQLLKETEAVLFEKEARFLQLKEACAAAKAEAASHQAFYQGLLDKQDGSENLLLNLEGLQGMVADMLDVPSVYERATEAILENRLKGIVLEDHAEIKKGLHLLLKGEKGRGIFLPRKPRSIKRKKEPSIVAGNGFVGRATDLIDYEASHEAVAEALLGHVYFAQDLDAALALWGAFPEVETWVTLQGEVVDRSGAVTGGERMSKGALSQKREAHALSKQVEALREDMKRLQDDIARTQGAFESNQEKKEALSETIRRLDVALMQRRNEQQNLASNVARLQEELQILGLELEENRAAESEFTRKEVSEREVIAETERLIVEGESSVDRMKKDLEGKHTRRDDLNDTVVHLRIAVTSLKEKRKHTLEKQARVEKEIAALEARKDDKALLKASLHGKLATGEAEERKTVRAIEQLSETLMNLRDHIREEQEIHAALSSDLQQLDEEHRSLDSALGRVQEALQQTALRKVEAEMNRQKVEEGVRTRYGTEIADYEDSGDSIPLETAQAKTEHLKRKLDEMGPVNMAAIEEYQALDTRYQFLTEQETDLTRSMEGLREAIAKINKTTRTLFVETFHILNQKFGEVFTSFFGGGTAALVLLDEAHPLESGIEMIAQPPGKGNRKITLLSGGEKALTAISLLFATFLIHPTPFCLLDEIDAPLDEENTRRFTNALIKMGSQTQFIIVTHNKLSMEIADVLYGVTMEETGLSKLVSVNLSNAAATNGAPSDLSAEAPEPALKEV
ncbi:MAG: chromosome segregation protein SMC [Nitrospiria bacterium]